MNKLVEGECDAEDSQGSGEISRKRSAERVHEAIVADIDNSSALNENRRDA